MVDTIDMLHTAGFDVNFQETVENCTAVYIAARHSQQAAMIRLLELGADSGIVSVRHMVCGIFGAAEANADRISAERLQRHGAIIRPSRKKPRPGGDFLAPR